MTDPLLRLRNIAAWVTYPGFTFEVFRGNNVDWSHTYYLRVSCPEGRCNVTDEDLPWKGRTWVLSQHMTDGEVVQTAFLALKTALEHELRERFTYKGVAVMGPHFDIDRLVALAASPEGFLERARATPHIPPIYGNE